MNVTPRVEELRQAFNNNAINRIRGPWSFTCDKCGLPFDITLNSQQIERLLRQGDAEVQCMNPTCIDSNPFSSWRHVLKVTLVDLIEYCLNH